MQLLSLGSVKALKRGYVNPVVTAQAEVVLSCEGHLRLLAALMGSSDCAYTDPIYMSTLKKRDIQLFLTSGSLCCW